ncbi:hypothetical protein [Pseudoalteromonas sp. OOF1S-7]|uniref:hypothetical protein n=1 Tax=Pseudoalteromonas sp. OOF1S-7 TaxID=2917757 RepID=UPI001EF60814|nr:hypothetical protein [Pseudoalteromonas sp. OOF1S-7]MCG7534972.1 hypothetical protein [Pseudoalteromonas sp. OOF1S-7]
MTLTDVSSDDKPSSSEQRMLIADTALCGHLSICTSNECTIGKALYFVAQSEFLW